MKLERLISTDLPKENIDKIRESHLKDFMDNVLMDISETSSEQREKATADFNAEIDKARKEYAKLVCKKNKELSQENTKIFLKNPIKIVKDLKKEDGHRHFSIGEILQMYGIGDAKIKRFGKGQLVGKGSDYPYTISNFLVTIKIGDFSDTIEVGSANDRFSKENLKSYAIEKLVEKIIEGNK